MKVTGGIDDGGWRFCDALFFGIHGNLSLIEIGLILLVLGKWIGSA
jgi:hypothetical protein